MRPQRGQVDAGAEAHQRGGEHDVLDGPGRLEQAVGQKPGAGQRDRGQEHRDEQRHERRAAPGPPRSPPGGPAAALLADWARDVLLAAGLPETAASLTAMNSTDVERAVLDGSVRLGAVWPAGQRPGGPARDLLRIAAASAT